MRREEEYQLSTITNIDTKLLDMINRYIKNAEAQWVIVVACGSGEFLEALSDSNPTIQLVGIDDDEKVIATARERLKGRKVMLWNEDFTKLSLPKAKADVVIALNLVQNYPNSLRTIRLLGGFTEGYLILSAPNLDNKDYARWILNEVAELSTQEELNREKVVTEIGGYCEIWTMDYFRDMVEGAGMRIVEVMTAIEGRINVIVARHKSKGDGGEGKWESMWRIRNRDPGRFFDYFRTW
ncbi:MAG: class I SAM-dependent methyltransferase [Thermoplasmata archaeon]